MKKQKGITLIALIITIIVMLILVTVTVTTAINGGLFESAKIASKKTERQSVLEELNAITAEFNADVYANPEKYDFSNDDILKNIIAEAKIRICGEENENPNSSITADEETVERSTTTDEEGKISFLIPFTYKGVEAKWKFVINEEIEYIELVFNGIGIQEIGDTPTVEPGENIKEVKDGVPIPTGFYYVTGTKNTGVVISDSSADENNPQGNNGSQFVWVPVQTNPKLKIDIDSDKKISKVTIMNLEGDKDEINVDKEYFEKTIDLSDNTIYEVAIEYADGTKDEKLYMTENQYKQTSKILTALKYVGLEESADMYKESNCKDQEFEFKIDIFKKMLEDDEDAKIYNTTDETPEKESVLKYGGFYIGRYEAGEDEAGEDEAGEDETTKKGNKPKNKISFTEAKTNAESKYNNNSHGVMSTLPSGSAWNSTANWIVKSRTKNWNDVFWASTDWGNYKQSTSDLKSTGSNENYSANNIYDLAGNLQEWTLEIETANERICRGSSYNVSGSPSMMSGDSISENAKEEETGYRLMLYIKK